MAGIAFIGLGNMGGPMAANLVKAGHQVHVFDLNAKSLVLAVSRGCISTDSAAEAMSAAECVVTMLPAGKHVESLMLGAKGLFQQAAPNMLFIDCSTIDVSTAQRLSTTASEQGLFYIDAPVSGGTVGAEAGTLSLMVGGEPAAFKRAKPLLKAMGKNIFHAGEAGAGQAAKTCNNMLLAILMAGTAEALNLGIKNGLDPTVLSEIMQKSSGDNWVLNKYNPVPNVMPETPASSNYQGGFMVDLMCKDLGLAMEASQGSQSPVPMGSAAKGLFDLHQAKGSGGLDFSSVIKLYEPKTLSN